MRAVFVDASETHADAMARFAVSDMGFDLVISRTPNLNLDALPELLAGAEIAIIDHTYFPTSIAQRCHGLRHVVFLGTGAASYMDIDEFAALAIEVHTVKGFGDTAVAESAFALMWAAARNIAEMDREIRKGNWVRLEALQITGKTLGLVGFGGIATELARIASGAGMKILVTNRSEKQYPNVTFCDIDRLLAESDIVSLHLLLCRETQNFLSRERIAMMKRGAILVNTARAFLVDEEALIEALVEKRIRHAALDVFGQEPLPANHPFCSLANVTLSAHSGSRTSEATDRVVMGALEHCRRLSSMRSGPLTTL